MATIKRFEELVIWQLARVQCGAVFELLEAGRFFKDPALADQINRSSGSVMDNIAEGFDRFSRSEFKQALVIARGSNAEVRSQLYRASDRHWINAEESTKLLKAASTLGVKIHNLVQHLQRSDYKEKPTNKPHGDIKEALIPYESDPSYDLPTYFITPENANSSNA